MSRDTLGATALLSAASKYSCFMSSAFFDSCRALACVIPQSIAVFLSVMGDANAQSSSDLKLFGNTLFFSTTLSEDHKTSCSSCHFPEHAFADPRPKSIGVGETTGTRNAPSLIGIADDKVFFWDGRRTKLEDAVLDPFTNPAELGLSSRDEIVERIRNDPQVSRSFQSVFGHRDPRIDDVARALTAFVASLKTGHSEFDEAEARHSKLSMVAQRGRELFEGIAGCAQCHHVEPDNRFTDNEYHFTFAPVLQKSVSLSSVARDVTEHPLTGFLLGNRILTDSNWASLGRFVVTRKPADIGSFRTPSLRNVAVTAPYMHDGRIATLEEAVDHEIYYRAQQSGRVAQITEAERSAIVEFLRALTDRPMPPVARRSSGSVSEQTSKNGWPPLSWCCKFLHY